MLNMLAMPESADEISKRRVEHDMANTGEVSDNRQPVTDLETAELDDGDGTPLQPRTMSRKAMKKAAKAERIAATKLERRAREKQSRKEKKRILAERRAAGELDDEDEETRRRAKRTKIDFAGNVVVDLGFDELMTDKEVKSLCSQLAYTHSSNRQSSSPFTLFFTSLNGQTYERLQALSDASYKRWSSTHWYTESYENLWYQEDVKADLAGDDMQTNNPPTPIMNPRFPKSSFVYLTADTDNELEEIRSDEIYIIGGICDHNRYKDLCLNKAVKSGIRSARLPIGRYLASLPTRKVLTVNQVFEILVKWIETKDWEQALYSVIPKRKFQQEKRDDVIDVAIAEGDSEKSP